MFSQPPRRAGDASRFGTFLLSSSWVSLIVLFCTYLALRGNGGEQELLQQLRQRQSARMTSLRGCVCPDTPLADINEPNVFPGPSNSDPDSPHREPLSFAEGCCGPMNLKEMHKVYEIGDANKPDWKEFQPEYNVFPGIVDWDPDSPGRIGEKDFKTKQLFDGNGGIIGMEDHKWDSDGWTRTPGSVAPDTQADYAQGANGMDRNVFADGYKFPHY